MASIVVTLDVSNRGTETREVQLQNMLLMLVTLLVLNSGTETRE